MEKIDLTKQNKNIDVTRNTDFLLGPSLLKGKALKKQIVFKFNNSNVESKIRYYCVLEEKSKLELEIVLTSSKQNIKNIFAYLEINILNLSEENYISISPILEIPQKNIVFEHKVAIGAPNHKWIKYLLSRGIPHKEALQLIAEGFITG